MSIAPLSSWSEITRRPNCTRTRTLGTGKLKYTCTDADCATPTDGIQNQNARKQITGTERTRTRTSDPHDCDGHTEQHTRGAAVVPPDFLRPAAPRASESYTARTEKLAAHGATRDDDVSVYSGFCPSRYALQYLSRDARRSLGAATDATCLMKLNVMMMMNLINASARPARPARPALRHTILASACGEQKRRLNCTR